MRVVSMLKRRVPYAAIAVPVVLALSLTACGSPGNSSDTGGTSGNLTSVKFQLNFVPYGGDAPFYLAVARGYYKDEGLNVTILPGKTGVETITSVASGQVEFGTAPDSQVISAAGQGTTVVSVGNRFAKPAAGVMVDARTGATKLADLQGKKILSASPVYAELLKSSMRAAGANPDSVNIVTVNGPALLSTYASGEGDGVITSVPFALPVVSARRDTKVISLADYGVTIPEFSFLAGRDLVTRQPDLVHKFLTATYRGMDAAMKDPKAAIDALMKAVPGINQQAATGQMIQYGETQCADGTAGKTVAYQDLDAWRKGAQQMVEINAAKAGIDVSQVVSNNFEDTTKTLCPTGWTA